MKGWGEAYKETFQNLTTIVNKKNKAENIN
jgi:hypothetical protein